MMNTERKMTLTAAQTEMIKNIALNDFTNINGAEPQSLADIGWVWASTVIETKSDKGVFMHLSMKGLVYHNNNKGCDACVTLTQAGLNAYFASK